MVGATLTFGSLFAGIGGLDLGFERAGLQCKWQVEIDPYGQQVLAKHWPDVARYRDIRYFLGSKRWRQSRAAWGVDVICGGFPCQDISTAGSGAGLAGERSGLWSEYLRIIRLLRPRFAVVENVSGLLAPARDGGPAPIGVILGQLAECGYDAEWQGLSARAFGSTQERFRIFIVAYPQGQRDGFRVLSAGPRGEGEGAIDAQGNGAGDGDSRRSRGSRGVDVLHEMREASRADHADITSPRLQGRTGIGCDSGEELATAERICAEDHADADGCIGRQGAAQEPEQGGSRAPGESGRRDSPFIGTGWWSTEPPVVRMVYGVPRRLVRPAITGLGNCVIPQVAEYIGRQLMVAANMAAEVSC